MTAIDRRTLLTGGAAGLLVGGASLWRPAGPAEAKIRSDRVRRTYGPVAILGDSASGGFMNGLNTSLTKAGVGPYRYDIKGSRRITQSWLTYDSGVSAAHKMIRDGFNPKAWVVALGSNGFYFFRRKVLSPKREIEAFLDEVGPSRHVVWLTIWTKRAGAYHKTFNSALHEMAARNSHFHVYDWAHT